MAYIGVGLLGLRKAEGEGEVGGRATTPNPVNSRGPYSITSVGTRHSAETVKHSSRSGVRGQDSSHSGNHCKIHHDQCWYRAGAVYL